MIYLITQVQNKLCCVLLRLRGFLSSNQRIAAEDLKNSYIGYEIAKVLLNL